MGNRQIDYTSWSKDELIKEIKRIKETTYGLVWHRDVPQEKIDVLINPDARTPEEMFANEVAGKPFPVLKEVGDKEVFSNKNNQTHILIEGDNYHSLAVLNFTHQEAIDVIYIDPPYNTGTNDFIYNDDYIDKEDPFRHSKWLSFMERRLRLARNLLKNNGVIFVSIGEDEFAQLKLLMDDPDIFGEKNFVTCISRVAKTASNLGKYFASSVDYILVYAKNIDLLDGFKDEVDASLYKKEDEKGKYRDDVAFYQASQKDLRPNQKYFVECPDGVMTLPPCSIQDEIMREGDGRWRWSKETYLANKDLLVFKKTKTSPLLDARGQKAEWNIYTKSYLSDREIDGTIPRNYLDNYINRKGADHIKKMGIKFDFSKPVELIEHLLKIVNKNKNITVVDFMAGSGTTGEAVLRFNKKDGGNRRFILCTNNENGIATDVCYPRLQKVMKGYKNNTDVKVEGLGGNLKYYTAYDFVESEPSDKNKHKLVNKCTEMLCIKEGIYDLVNDTDSYKILKSHDERYLGIIFYEDAIDEYKEAIKKIDNSINTYVFSLGDDPHTTQFSDVADKVVVQAIPEIILKVYQEIFR